MARCAFTIFSLLVLGFLTIGFYRSFSIPAAVESMLGGKEISNYKRFCIWFGLVFSVYMLFKYAIYSGLFYSVPVVIGDVEARQEHRVRSFNSNAKHSSTRSKVYVVDYLYPTYIANIDGREFEFESNRILNKRDAAIGAKHSFVCMSVWGEPSYCDFGGVYFFRHDFFAAVFFLFCVWVLFSKRDIFNDKYPITNDELDGVNRLYLCLLITGAASIVFSFILLVFALLFLFPFRLYT